jgi:hypothetical protein
MKATHDENDDNSRQRRRRDADQDRPRGRMRRADDDAAPPSRFGNAGLGGQAATVLGVVLTALVILSLVIRLARLADRGDQARRVQRENEEAIQRAAAAKLQPKIPEFEANLANLKRSPDRFVVIYFREQPFDPARQNDVARALEGCLRSPDPWVGYDACLALAKWGDPNSVPSLVEFHQGHPEDHFKARVLQALAGIKGPASEKAISQIQNGAK